MRFNVVSAVTEQNKRYFQSLTGRLAHCSSVIPEADRAPVTAEQPVVRRYYHVPEAVQDTVTAAELTALKSWAPEAIALFRRVVLDGDVTGLTPNQVAIVRDIHALVLARHRPPTFGSDDTWITPPLDYSVIQGRQSALDSAVSWVDSSAQALLLLGQANARYHSFLAISHPTPKQAAIKIPMALRKAQFQHLCGQRPDGSLDPRFIASSFTLGLGPHGAVTLKAVVVQQKQAPRTLTECRHLIGRDFGMKNTVSLSVRQLPEPLDAAKLAEIQQFTKEQAQQFLTSHALQVDAPVVQRLRFSAEGFLKRINAYCAKIESYSSRIDKAYLALAPEQLRVRTALGLEADAWLHKALATHGHPEHHALRQALDAHNTVACLKHARRQAYRKIESLKKHWFGFLSNVETRLAQAYKAAVVREVLDYEAIEKADPAYKGRVFNKMVNHTARGLYQRRASAKFQCNGIPELALPAYYTSTTCVPHAKVHKPMRNGDSFSCPHRSANGLSRENADEHAADTISAYLLLTPYVTPTPSDGVTP